MGERVVSARYVDTSFGQSPGRTHAFAICGGKRKSLALINFYSL